VDLSPAVGHIVTQALGCLMPNLQSLQGPLCKQLSALMGCYLLRLDPKATTAVRAVHTPLM
jgi:hypothetical protein